MSAANHPPSPRPQPADPSPRYDHLAALEAESMHIMREVAAEFERPVLLFSGGKDSICMLRIAEKAFRPGKFPFPLMHIDTTWKPRDMIVFRDRKVMARAQSMTLRREKGHDIAAACGQLRLQTEKARAAG